MKLKINLPLILSWTFLSVFILLLVGWYEFNWNLFKITPLALASLLLFFQALTLSAIRSRTYKRVNQLLFALQVALAVFLITKIIPVRFLWKWEIFLLFFATQVYLIDLNERFNPTRKMMNWIFIGLVLVSCLSFLLLNFSYVLLSIGFISMIATSILLIGNIIFYKKQ